MATTTEEEAVKLANARTQAALASAYFEDIAPAQATAQRELNTLADQQKQNEDSRTKQRNEQFRQIASKYAARGIRGPIQTTEKKTFDDEQDAVRLRESLARNNANLSYLEQFGVAGSEDFDKMTPAEKAARIGENFFSNPTLYGTVGTAARRAALARLQEQGANYTNVSA
jgi:hypothetical protein